ncbi:MAG: SCO family protein [Gammaproteobacteria bacterium]|nr:SCO family protein [Gammaproteobacteria bacterium]
MRQKAFVIVLAVLIMTLSLVWYRGVAPGLQPASQTDLLGTVWPDPRPLPEFQLSDHSGETFDRDRLRGQWTLMFFGYTSCPDICPTTMFTLRNVAAEMDKSGVTAPTVVLVTVDPQRDDAANLARYVGNFNPDFFGVRGPDDELHVLTMQIGAMYERDAADEQGNYDVAHSASLFLVDPQARMHAVFSPPHKPADIAQKLTAIRLQYEQG